MSDWISTTLIIPAAILDAANRLSAIIDPDTGGALTFTMGFPLGSETPTNYGTQSMIAPKYVALLQLGDPAMVYGALSMLAEECGRELPTWDDCADFTASVIVRPGEDLMAVAAELGLVVA